MGEQRWSVCFLEFYVAFYFLTKGREQTNEIKKVLKCFLRYCELCTHLLMTVDSVNCHLLLRCQRKKAWILDDVFSYIWEPLLAHHAHLFQ